MNITDLHPEHVIADWFTYVFTWFLVIEFTLLLAGRLLAQCRHVRDAWNSSIARRESGSKRMTTQIAEVANVVDTAQREELSVRRHTDPSLRRYRSRFAHRRNRSG